MRTVEFVENILNYPVFMNNVKKPPEIVPYKGPQPIIKLDLENYRFSSIVILTSTYSNFISHYMMQVNFLINGNLKNNYILIKDKKYGGKWKFMIFNPEDISGLNLNISIKILRNQNLLEKSTPVLERLNKIKNIQFIKRLNLEVSEKFGNMVYYAKIFYPIRILQDKNHFIISILSFMDIKKIKLDMYFNYANVVLDAIGNDFDLIDK
ncbi:MAG: hypothetical protein ACTSPY_01060 [Candidatus Helarchaeota archaeon]